MFPIREQNVALGLGSPGYRRGQNFPTICTATVGKSDNASERDAALRVANPKDRCRPFRPSVPADFRASYAGVDQDQRQRVPQG